MGFETKAVVGSDSSAARGITARLGTGRVRHLEARHLWIQDKCRDKKLTVRKVSSEENRADAQTRALDPTRHWHLMQMLPFDFSAGCEDKEGGSMQVSALTVGQVSSLIMTVLVADGVTGTAAFENETCAMPEGTAEGDISPLQLMVALLVVGAIIGALAQQVLVARLVSRKPATCEVAVQTEWQKKRVPLRADRSQQTAPLHVHEYWAMPLHEVRAVAMRRGVPNAATSTRMALAGVLIQMDLSAVR